MGSVKSRSPPRGKESGWWRKFCIVSHQIKEGHITASEASVCELDGDRAVWQHAFPSNWVPWPPAQRNPVKIIMRLQHVVRIHPVLQPLRPLLPFFPLDRTSAKELHSSANEECGASRGREGKGTCPGENLIPVINERMQENVTGSESTETNVKCGRLVIYEIQGEYYLKLIKMWIGHTEQDCSRLVASSIFMQM